MDDSVWLYHNPDNAGASTMNQHMDDNWNQLYKAFLNFNTPLSIIINTLEFNNSIPDLSKSGAGTLTPLLFDSFNWSILLPTFDSKTSIS